jgi:ubiquinone/menaquinone biosynthesis C-methylase UbiE
MDSAIFEVPSLRRAREIILTPEGGASTETRWRHETPYLVDQIERELRPGPGRTILDYGCGIGRLAKALIARSGCRVIGVDPSLSMRSLSTGYVRSNRFLSVPPAHFDQLLAQGLKVDGAICIWVLQHVADPQVEIDRIWRALSQNGRLYVLNNLTRAVPVRGEGWTDDGIDIQLALTETFNVVGGGAPDPRRVTEHLSEVAFWGLYERS